jgi:serine/threonine-protein kinase
VFRLIHDRALRAFAELLARQPELDPGAPGAPDAPDAPDAIDQVCRTEPELEPELRRLARERAEVEVEAPRVEATNGKALGGKALGRQARTRSRYVLLGEAGRGGMGIVLRVWDTVLERPLAMKVLDSQALPADEAEAGEVLARFLAEARIAGQLEHPGIVPIHDLGSDERGRVYFTMPYFEGRTLDEVFDLARSRTEGWSLGRALLALSKVCEVMAYAHSRGVIHRDLKPSNLIAGAFGQVYVLDWGLAKVLDPRAPEPVQDAGEGPPQADAAGPGETLDGTVAGTPPYMAPEQALGQLAQVSYRSDVYALGAMLYRLLAGRAPYAPRHGRDEPAKTVELIRRGPPTPLRRLAPHAPPALAAICERAMARAPEDRYASVEDLARDLNAYLEGRLGDGGKG